MRELDGHGMTAALRLADHELPAQELETLVGAEAPASDELRHTRPGSRRGCGVGYVAMKGRLSSTDRSVNVCSGCATRPAPRCLADARARRNS